MGILEYRKTTECGTPGEMRGDPVEWPTLKSSVAGARLTAREQLDSQSAGAGLITDLIAEVETLRDQVSEQKKELTEATNASRWAEIRIDLLEQALRDAHAEAGGTAEQVELCVEEIRMQDERLSSRLERVEGQLDTIDGSNTQLEQDVIDLRLARTETEEHMEELTANLLAVTEKAQTLALLAKENAELSVGEAERVSQNLQELSEVNAEIRSMAEKATDRAERLSEDLDDLTEESREVRVMAEKAKDRADYSADSAAATQVELEREAAALREELRDASGHASLEAIDEAIAELRWKLAAAGGPASDEPTPPKKRWEAHLRHKPELPKQRALPAPKADDSQKAGGDKH